MKKYFLSLLILSWFSNENYLYAQYSNSWIGLKPMLYNPSFAGSTGGARIVGAGIYEKKYSSGYNLSYDNFISKIHTGIGINVAYNQYTGSYKSKYLNAAFVISPKISLKGKYTIAPSIEFLYGTMKGKPTFYYDGNLTNYQFRAGLLFNSKNMYAGYTIYFPNQINELDLPKNTAKYHSFQIGYKFQRNPESKFSFTPQAVVVLRGPNKFTSTTIVTDTDTITYTSHANPTRLHDTRLDLTFRYKKILWGIGSSSAMLGFQSNKWRIMYTHTWSNNFGITSNRDLRAELSVRLLVPKKNKTVIDY